jgi:hypothetical protein
MLHLLVADATWISLIVLAASALAHPEATAISARARSALGGERPRS